MPAQCSLYWQGTDAAIEVHDPTRGSAAHAWTARLDVTVQSIKKKKQGGILRKMCENYFICKL